MVADFTPQAPHWRVDWPAIRDAFAWVRAMTGIEQEPEWHAEGDVEVHTRMVCEAMVANEVWRNASPASRKILFASALLHDVAKPACTRMENGRWTSPRHAKVGQRMARALLWSGQAGLVPAFAQREAIAGLARHHGLPLTFMNKPDPARAVIQASLEANLFHAAQLAQADVEGRCCSDQSELLDRVQLFREYADELSCLSAPKAFESDHHRFIYCAAQKPLEYVPFDSTTFTATLMSGLPGSGKSTWARANAHDVPIVALDDLREKLSIGPAHDQGPVINAAREQAKSFLRERRPFIWDATNITRDLRGGLVALFSNYGARVRIVYVEAPWPDMFHRNRARPHPVPDAIMHKLIEKLEIPTPSEAHDVRYIIN